MAWIAAIISGLAGGITSSNQQKANKKALGQAGVLNKEGYQTAINALKDYQGIGKEGAYSLAQLMGLKGYRTPEEIALTEYLQSRPVSPGAVANERDYRTTLDKQEKYSTLGDTIGMVLEKKNKSAPEKYRDKLPTGVTGWYKERGKKRQAKADAANAAAEAAYQASLAAWEQKRAQLEQQAEASLANYDPTAALRATPGYQFRYDTGLNAVRNQQVGRQLSGRAAQELSRYGQGFASNEFGNEFNRRLALATGGQSAATNVGNLAIGQGGQAANLALLGGQNQSNYYSDMNNVVQQGLGNYLTYKNRNNRQNTPYASSYQNPDVAETYMYTED